ncbi:MAG: hypothetical protein JRH08_15885 [Deltaproteobacteria bacterium]|nr:hypothetical protein [Deltaproteobacteria bacterium]MBW1929426.1 hypothetical protein [Deltaproteobacteria bacterium]MBW2026965.1 hypothetical protein [Deltaproteobacteria bacterium]MBW2127109.1 hypothetical protein [Deltaproteobacteria bacterium]
MSKRIYQGAALATGVFLLVILARPNPYSVGVGAVLVAIGEAMRIWASGHLQRNVEITTSGPYAYLRDPLYFGRLFLLVGLCVMGWGYDLILLLIGLGIFFFQYMPRKYRKEMARLERLFGEEYKRYAAATRSLIPRLKPYPYARHRTWRFNLFWKVNREQYLLCGIIILCAVIISKL